LTFFFVVLNDQGLLSSTSSSFSLAFPMFSVPQPVPQFLPQPPKSLEASLESFGPKSSLISGPDLSKEMSWKSESWIGASRLSFSA
jgi:hypothetical protein